MRSALAAAVVSVVVTLALPQEPPRDAATPAMTGPARIDGTVVADDDTHAPLRRAILSLSRSGGEEIRTASTDDAGRFAFDNLLAGTYTLTANKGGYISMNFGASKPRTPGRPFELKKGERFSAPPIPLLRGAVIAGRLLDRNARPAAGMTVQAAQFVVVNGERRARYVMVATTNAHGDYRIHGLLPGDYIVSATSFSMQEVRDVGAAELAWAQQQSGPPPAPGRAYGYAPSLYPGTPDAASATPVTVGRGEERTGVDFMLQYTPVTRVTGVVTMPDGRPAPGLSVFPTPKQSNTFQFPNIFIGRTNADGAFTLATMTPGDYMLTVRGVPVPPGGRAASAGPGTQPPALWAMAELSITGQDVIDVPLQLQPGMSITGQVRFKTGTKADVPTDFARIQVRVLPQGPPSAVLGGAGATVNADGTFRITGIMPGAYRFGATVGGSGWALRSAMIGESDVADVPFEVRPGADVSGILVTVSDALGGLSGSVTSTAGGSTPDLRVFVFPTERAFWATTARRIASARTGLDGTYAINGLPPGEYYLCALSDLDTTLQYEPTYLESLVPASLKITLAEGEKKTQHLRIGG